jgi:hypothetical protein
MLEYLRVPLVQRVKWFGLNEQRQLVRLPTRKDKETHLAPIQPPFPALGVRKQEEKVHGPQPPPVTRALWSLRVLCVDGLEYTWGGKLVGPGLPHLVEYLLPERRETAWSTSMDDRLYTPRD